MRAKMLMKSGYWGRPKATADWVKHGVARINPGGADQILRPSKLTSRPKVSVVIPCYNYGHFLRAAVGSVVEQRDVDLELIIVDDASSDGSVDIARRLAAGDARISVIAHAQNQGHIATYNDGLARVSGDYVVLLSADDLLTAGSLSRSVALLESNPAVGFVYGFSREFESVPPPSRQYVRSWSVWSGQSWVRECCRQGKNFVYTPEVVMRTAAYREVGGYELGLPHSADFYLWMRTAARWDVGRINGADQAYYRVHGKNMHLTSFLGVITDLRERRRTFDWFFDRDRTCIPAGGDLPVIARKAMAEEALRLATDAIDGDNPDLPAGDEYAAEALDLYPDLEVDRRWFRYQRTRKRVASRRRPGVEQRLARVARTVEDKIRWRRWRWSGT